MTRLSPLIALTLAACATGGPASAPRLDAAALPAAGPAERCLVARRIGEWRPVAPGVLMVRAGDRWYRNDFAGRCPALRPDRIVTRRTTLDPVCDGDQADIVDPMSGIGFGACTFTRWLPVAVPKGARF